MLRKPQQFPAQHLGTLDHQLLQPSSHFSLPFRSGRSVLSPLCFQGENWSSESKGEWLLALPLTTRRSEFKILAPEIKPGTCPRWLVTWHDGSCVAPPAWPSSGDKLCPFLANLGENTNYLPEPLIEPTLYLVLHDLIMQWHRRSGP